MEKKRFEVNISCEEDVLHECYLPHFRQCLEEGGAESIMSAYNSVNGEFAGDNAGLLNGVVRDTWGFEDVTISSDWLWGTRDAVKSVKAGLDLEMPLMSTRRKHLPAALKSGKIDWAPIDRCGKRVLTSQLKYYARIRGTSLASAKEVAGCDEHRELARESACQGMVLLKNSNGKSPTTSKSILPLNPRTCRKVLVVGKLATSQQTGDAGSSYRPDNSVVTPLKGMQSQESVDVEHLDGTDLDAVEKASRDCDAVLVIVGYTSIEEGEYVTTFEPEILTSTLPYLFPYRIIAKTFSFLINKAVSVYGAIIGDVPGGDRDDLRLTDEHETLLKRVADFAGDKMIVGVECSGPVILPPSVTEQAAAILFTGYGGCEFGHALKDVIFGEKEPGGRLAYQIVEDESDLPGIDMDAKQVTYDRFWGYRLQQKRNTRPAYPFGFGLGYGDLRINSFQPPKNIRDRFFTVEVTVKNEGVHASSSVIQVYAGASNGSGNHQSVLVGFSRTPPLEPSASATILIDCRLDPVAKWNVQKKTFNVSGGDYSLLASRYEGDESSLKETVQVKQAEWGVKTGSQ